MRTVHYIQCSCGKECGYEYDESFSVLADLYLYHKDTSKGVHEVIHIGHKVVEDILDYDNLSSLGKPTIKQVTLFKE